MVPKHDTDTTLVLSRTQARKRRHIEALRQACAMQQEALAQTTREVESSRAKNKRILWCLLLSGLAVSGWFIYQVYHIIEQGYILDCPRLSSLNCHRLYPDAQWYWVMLIVRAAMAILFFAASIVAVLFIRAFSKTAPIVQTMRNRLQRLQDELTALEPEKQMQTNTSTSQNT